MTIENFNRTIDIWIKELHGYSFIQLCTKPFPGRWSIGQVYRHLIDDAQYYIAQMEICITTNDNAKEESSSNAKTMSLNNDFPDEALEGTPDNAFIPQPASKEQLMNDLRNLRSEMNKAALMVSESHLHGKTKHPGLNYFSAGEWLQFADMHFRHHSQNTSKVL